MDIGMLWSKRDRRQSLDAAVREAAEYYLSKYGLQATLCHCHPQALLAAGNPSHVGAIRMAGSRLIGRDDLWIGVGETEDVR